VTFAVVFALAPALAMFLVRTRKITSTAAHALPRLFDFLGFL